MTAMKVGSVFLTKLTFCFNCVFPSVQFLGASTLPRTRLWLSNMGIVTKIRFEELGLYFIALLSSSSRTAVVLWRQSAILVSLFVIFCD